MTTTVHSAVATDQPDAAESLSYATALARSRALEEQIAEHAAQDPDRFRVLTGDRPTGALHIGHYLASLRNRVRLQQLGVRTFIVIADYQVVTDRDRVGAMQDNVLGLVTDYVAAGVDPARTTIFTHSAVPALNQLMLPFLAVTTDAELRRNPTVKEELTLTGGRALSGLLLTYPVHQAADILFCGAQVVPVGRDQLPHLEQARLIARRFNERFAGGETVFTQPEALLTEAPLVLGTDGTKMGKSKGNTVALRHTADETAALIRAARTDVERRITYDPVSRPQVANLLRIAAGFLDRTPVDLAEQLGDGGSAALKRLVTDAVNEGLAAHRARRREVAADPGYLRAVLHNGNAVANAVAEQTLARVREAMQMTY